MQVAAAVFRSAPEQVEPIGEAQVEALGEHPHRLLDHGPRLESTFQLSRLPLLRVGIARELVELAGGSK